MKGMHWCTHGYYTTASSCTACMTKVLQTLSHTTSFFFGKEAEGDSESDESDDSSRRGGSE